MPRLEELHHSNSERRKDAIESYKDTFTKLQQIRHSMKESGAPEEISLDDFMHAQTQGLAEFLRDMEQEADEREGREG